MKRIVIASNNPGKLRELAALLEPLGIEAVPQASSASAKPKSRTTPSSKTPSPRRATRAAPRACRARDDSGLCVAALHGEPGVHSAYFAGSEGSREERDARNNAKLVELLHARPMPRLLLLRARARAIPEDPVPIVADARWQGRIVDIPRGTGLRVRPAFHSRGSGFTAAELDASDKNRVSHRAQALAALAAKLK
jgi:XTP/dITP diphosphohydrolase